ncbi:sigma-54-dependent Fis family transcriptional regulator [candidate division KSB1 bacterium]|nr:sigma-54-dependent Fis family transcriptional regulator [candidate division KSB1 bacterium]
MDKEFNKVLLIDDDVSLNKVLFFQISQMGFEVTTAFDGKTGTTEFKKKEFDIIITDLQLPDLKGMELVRLFRGINKRVIIIIITAFGTIDNAIEAVKIGADDYLTKPFGKETLRFVIEKAIRLRQLEQENLQLRGELFDKYDFNNIISKSSAMEDVLKLTGRVAESDATVLIQGESGTGKELVARAIHYNSPRKDKPLITVNCPSIPESLMESEIFGHVKGAFTGALKDRIGKFALANNGTIFLDEIGDLKEDLQARLLRVLQEKEFEKVGDSKLIKVDARVVAATNKYLEELVQVGKFREDLFYRLNVVTILIPPLRERKDDIPFLIDHFLKKHSKNNQYQIADEAFDIMLNHEWPGNVRELENTIERAIVISQDEQITPELLPSVHKKNTIEKAQPEENNLTLDEIEQRAINSALKKTGGNQTKAAELLGIPRHVLIYRMKKLGVIR